MPKVKAKDDVKLAESWRALCGSHARVSCALEKTLQAEHALTPSEFDVLERLAGGEDGALRMQDLAEGVHLSQSALSRLVGRLEADGLVERSICSADRRGIYARLTKAGRERYDAARPTHRRVLAELLGA
jgi:DNA-binding MarR family transcriptional regulator